MRDAAVHPIFLARDQCLRFINDLPLLVGLGAPGGAHRTYGSAADCRSRFAAKGAFPSAVSLAAAPLVKGTPGFVSGLVSGLASRPQVSLCQHETCWTHTSRTPQRESECRVLAGQAAGRAVRAMMTSSRMPTFPRSLIQRSGSAPGSRYRTAPCPSAACSRHALRRTVPAPSIELASDETFSIQRSSAYSTMIMVPPGPGKTDHLIPGTSACERVQRDMSCLVVMCAISVTPVITASLLWLFGTPRAGEGTRQQTPAVTGDLKVGSAQHRGSPRSTRGFRMV